MSEKITLEKEELVKLLDEVSTKAASAAVEAKLKELGETGNKFAFKGSFAGMTPEDQAKLSGKEKTAQFIKAVFHKDMNSIAAFKTLTEGTGSAGGFIVPEEFAAEVNRIVEDFGLIAKLARKFPMKSDTLNVPRLSATVTVSYPGEATAGTGSQPTFEQVVLSSKSLVGITPMSNELLADATVSVVDLLAELFAEAIAGMLDTQGLAGTGSPFTGLLVDTGVTVVQPANGTSNTTFATCATGDNTRDLITNVKPWALQGAAFIMHRSVWAILQKSKASTSGEYFISTATPFMTNPVQVKDSQRQLQELYGDTLYCFLIRCQPQLPYQPSSFFSET